MAPHRSAAYARRQLHELQLGFLRRSWRWILLVAAVPLVTAVPGLLVTTGTARGAIVGAALATSLWLAGATSVILSGSATMLLGIAGETFVSERLRSLRREGWRTINGLRMARDSDIDHLSVGPAGIVIVETKWRTAPRWSQHDAVSAARQLERSVFRVRHQFARHLGTVPLRAVVVVTGRAAWDGLDSIKAGEFDVVAGSDLLAWMRSLPDAELDRATLDRLWAAVTKFAAGRDRADHEHGFDRPPTLTSSAWHVAGQPVVGALGSLVTFPLVGKVLEDWRATAAAWIATALLGWWATRSKRLRGYALGWTAVASVLSLMLVVLAVLAVV